MRKLLSLMLLLGAGALVQQTFAQAPPPINPHHPTSAPVDGAAGALLLVVASYGYLRLKKKDQASENEVAI